MRPIVIVKPELVEKQPENKFITYNEDGKEVDLKPGQCIGPFRVGDDNGVELDVRLALDPRNSKYTEFYHEFQTLLKKYRESHVVKYISGMR